MSTLYNAVTGIELVSKLQLSLVLESGLYCDSKAITTTRALVKNVFGTFQQATPNQRAVFQFELVFITA